MKTAQVGVDKPVAGLLYWFTLESAISERG